jgi:hypothetical protein
MPTVNGIMRFRQPVHDGFRLTSGLSRVPKR